MLLCWERLGFSLKNKILQIILALLFAALFSLVHREAAEIMSLILILIVICPKWRINIIAIGTLIFQLVPLHSAFQYSEQRLVALLRDAPIKELTNASWLTGALSVCTLYVLIYFRRILLRTPRIQRPLAWGLVTTMTFFFVSAELVHWGLIKGGPAYVLIWILVCLMKYVWFFSYDLQNNLKKNETVFWRAAYYTQFWTFNLVSGTVPKGEKFWTKFEVKDHLELTRLRVHALLLLVWGIILKTGFGVFHRALYQEGFLSINQMLVIIKNGQHLGSKQAALYALLDNFLYIGNIVCWGHIMVSIVWFCGYKIPKNTDSPYLSSNPLDFFGRMYFYLKEILFQIFYFPCFMFLKGVPLFSRVFLSLFYAVFFGKFLINYTKQVGMIVEMGVGKSLHQHFPYMIYCLLLTLALFPYLLNDIRGKQKRLLNVPSKIGISLAIFIGYTLMRLFDTLQVNDIAINFKLLLTVLGGTT